MEAIEFALAEPGASHVTTVRATARDVLDGRRRPEAVLDSVPQARRAHPPRRAHGMRRRRARSTTGECALVPAELVFLPYRPHRAAPGPPSGRRSNGLSSGNTLARSDGARSLRARRARRALVPGRSRHERRRWISTRRAARPPRWSRPFAPRGSSCTCARRRTTSASPYFTADHQRPRRVRPAAPQRRLRLPPAPRRRLRARRGRGGAEPAVVHPRRA